MARKSPSVALQVSQRVCMHARPTCWGGMGRGGVGHVTNKIGCRVHACIHVAALVANGGFPRWLWRVWCCRQRQCCGGFTKEWPCVSLTAHTNVRLHFPLRLVGTHAGAHRCRDHDHVLVHRLLRVRVAPHLLFLRVLICSQRPHTTPSPPLVSSFARDTKHM
jgi:hypothetical protein